MVSRKTETALAYSILYNQGLSCTKIARIYGVTRQSVWELLKSHNYPLRPKKKLPFVMFDGMKFTLSYNGYYRATTDKCRLLHREIWESFHGTIPHKFDIHHVNENKQDNRIENLECISKSDHARLHGTAEKYKFKKGVVPHNKRKVRCVETGEVYLSAKEAALSVNRSPSAITQSIRNGTKSAGVQWVWLD